MIQTNPIPTDNPSGSLILYENLIVAAAAGSEKAITPNTYERWVDAVGNMQSTFQLATPTIIDTVAIAAHNLGTKAVTITIEVAPTVAGAFVEVGSIAPTDNNPIMFRFDPTLVADVRFTGTVISGNTDKELGVISAGIALQMPRDIYGGHSPITLSTRTEFRAAKSESGQILGKDIIRKGLKTSYKWRFLDDQFIRNEFKAFKDSAITTPFFIQWRPDYYSNEAAYGEVNQDIHPTNSGGGIRLMDVGFTLEAHAE